MFFKIKQWLSVKPKLQLAYCRADFKSINICDMATTRQWCTGHWWWWPRMETSLAGADLPIIPLWTPYKFLQNTWAIISILYILQSSSRLAFTSYIIFCTEPLLYFDICTNLTHTKIIETGRKVVKTLTLKLWMHYQVGITSNQAIKKVQKTVVPYY